MTTEYSFSSFQQPQIAKVRHKKGFRPFICHLIEFNGTYSAYNMLKDDLIVDPRKDPLEDHVRANLTFYLELATEEMWTTYLVTYYIINEWMFLSISDQVTIPIYTTLYEYQGF